jgi:tetratricopeptide (TPR) repeat protein
MRSTYSSWLFVFLLAVLLIKTAVLIQLGNHPLLQPHGELDTAYYVDLAHKVAEGGPLAVTEPFPVSPLYVFFLALLFKLSGGSLMAARVVQILLGTAAALFLYLTARQWFGEKVARVASILYALTGFVTFSEILVLQTALDPFLTSCALYFISRMMADERRWVSLAGGMAAGLLALNRPNSLAYGLGISGLIAFLLWRQFTEQRAVFPLKRALLRPGLYLVGIGLVLLPNLIRNYAVSGEAILISSHGGFNFFMGNHAGADGTYQAIAGFTPSITGQARDAKRVAEEAAGRRLSIAEVSDHFYGLAWDWVSGNPGDAFRLFLRKLAILVNKTNVALNTSYDFYRRESSLLGLLIIGPWLLVPLGLAGLCVPVKKSDRVQFWVWGSFIPVYGLSVALFFVSDRYRLPWLIALCVTSAALLVWLVEQARARRAKQIALTGLVLGALVAASQWNLALNDGVEDEETLKAAWMIEQRDINGALEYVSSIAPRHSRPAMLYFHVGGAFAAAGRYEDAVAQFQKALAIDPNPNSIRLALAQALSALKRPEEALPHLARAYDENYERKMSGPLLIWALAAAGKTGEASKRLATFPDDLAEQHQTAFFFGSVAFEGRVPAEAERWYRIASKLRPDEPESHIKLGATLLLLNRAQEAVVPLETAVRLAPGNAEARRNLALAYANCSRFAEARAQGEEALRLDPGEEQVRSLLKALPATGKR